MKFRNDLTSTDVRQALHYSPDTGQFYRLNALGGIRHGAKVGYLRHGRLVIRVGKAQYQASRLAYIWMIGEWPPSEIDHIDGDKINNKWANLRPVTHSQNLMNRPYSRNALGVKGVTFDRSRVKFLARITKGGVTRSLGRFDTVTAAKLAYESAAILMFGEYAKI